MLSITSCNDATATIGTFESLPVFYDENSTLNTLIKDDDTNLHFL